MDLHRSSFQLTTSHTNRTSHCSDHLDQRLSSWSEVCVDVGICRVCGAINWVHRRFIGKSSLEVGGGLVSYSCKNNSHMLSRGQAIRQGALLPQMPHTFPNESGSASHPSNNRSKGKLLALPTSPTSLLYLKGVCGTGGYNRRLLDLSSNVSGVWANPLVG